MARRIGRAMAALLVGVLALGLVWLIGMRKKDSVVVRMQRRINRRVFNPRQMQTAGTPGAYAAVVRHVGRTSGRSYETPVGAAATEDGFVIALVYGAGSDWLKNILAAQSAEIVHQGRTHQVGRPRVVPLAEAIDDFPPAERRSLRLVGVQQCLRVRTAAAD